MNFRKYIYLIIGILVIAGLGFSLIKRDTETEENRIINTIPVAGQQLKSMLSEVTPGNYPRTSDKNGKVITTPMDDWTEGFFPGSLWYMYELTGEQFWEEQATVWTEHLEPMKYTRHHHDVGFIIYCSFGHAYRMTGNEHYKEVLIEAANSLCSRYDDTVGSIKSWDYRKSWNGRDDWFYPVIMDNMMNLELLYFASKVTGNKEYAKIANRHAETTLKNQIREDYSTYHVANYDPQTGEVLHQATFQGFADNSTWARGQAWAIYGFTMVYRETKNPVFLETAVNCANYWLNHPNLPEDKIPYWDFHAGQEGYIPDWNYDPDRFKEVFRDASAGAITASALLELAGYAENGAIYRKAAEDILLSLSTPAYLAEPGTNANFVLKHSVGSIPHNNEIDVPIVYADYYFLEAIHRYLTYNHIKTK